MKSVRCMGLLVVMSLIFAGCALGSQQIDENKNETTVEDESVSENEISLGDSVVDSEDSSVQTVPEEVQEIPEEEIVEIGALNSDNDFMEIVPVGVKCKVDLNGDGYKDTVTYQSAEGDSQFITFKINEGDYSYSLYLSDEGIYLATPNTDWYYITDLDPKDKYKEIAILDWGPSDDLVTYFIRFTGDGTYCLGHVPGFPYDESFRIKGDKTVESYVNLGIFQSWSAPAVYVSGSDETVASNLTLKKQDFYEPYNDDADNGASTLLKDIKIYKENKLGSETIDMKASDAAITFVKTDNAHWVYLEREDGIKGWLYIDGYDTVVIGNNSYNARDLFNNLSYAG